MKTRVVNSRLRLLLLVILFTFAGLGARAAWLQTVRASSLAAMAQTQAKKPISLPAGRGTIYDRVGNPLAIGEQAIDVDADPMQISDPRREARIAAKVLGIPVRPLYRQLSDRSSGFVYVQRKAPPRLAAKLMKRHLVGFTFEPDQKRVYPQGTVAAPVLGYAGTDNTGLSGLELELNKELKGRPGSATEVRDALGQAVNTIQERPARNGRDVYLTLDSHIQANAEQVLEQTVSQWHAKDATAIVLDPRTGAILGMAQEPGYNANGYPAATAHDLTLDHAVSDVFEPGSVFKVVTIGGALSQHDITPNTAIQVPGALHVADRVIHDAEPHGLETLKVKQILQRSSNIGTDIIAARYLGESGLKKWMARFGFGRRTGIDFPDESRGLLPSYWSGSTIGTVPIGQGVSVTGDPARLRLRRHRKRRRVGPAAPRRPRRRPGDAEAEATADPRARRRCPAAHDAERRRLGPGNGRARCHSRLRRRRQDGNGAEAWAERLHPRRVRRDVRRDGAGVAAAPPRARDHRRASRVDLRRPRRGARVRADRVLRPPVPRSAAGSEDQVTGSLPGTLAAEMDLERLVAALEPVEVLGRPSVEVRDLAYDARAVGPGTLFFAVPGTRADGHDFAPEAVERGAVALVVERALDLPVPQVVVRDARAAMAPAADVFFGEPTRELQVVGVTGTSGKTTTSFLLFAILAAAGRRPGLLGTVEARVGGERRGVVRTTPEAIDLQRVFREMLDAGDRSCAMEASSHASVLHRLDRVRFAVLVFTNLSQDHLDFHGDMESYFEAKRQLFLTEPRPLAVVNVGDEYGRRLAQELPEAITFSADDASALDGIDLRLRGRFNVENALGALNAARALGIGDDAIRQGLESVRGVPGRFESVDAGQPFHVIVDYAHKPDALEKVLRAARGLANGNRVICVVGAGGDRDRGKRAVMGRLASELADVTIVTSDNPRSEDPEAIAAEIVAGAEGAMEVELDRATAIRQAVELAQPGDVVLIAGKGAEQGQEFADRTVPFDDRETAKDALRALEART